MSHHHYVSIVYLSQNIVYRSKQSRTMSLNANYTVLVKNPRIANGAATLARQMYPRNGMFTLEACKDATQKFYDFL
jgi:hypothetical protein